VQQSWLVGRLAVESTEPMVHAGKSSNRDYLFFLPYNTLLFRYVPVLFGMIGFILQRMNVGSGE
jgi:hypothetical protein